MEKSKKALITGGAGFLGIEQAYLLAQDGFEVVLVDADAERLEMARAALAQRMIDASSMAVDLAAPDAGAAVGRAYPDGFDVLVNNVGYVIVKPLQAIERAEFERQQQVNAHAAFYLSQALAPVMIERGWGRIVNIGSTMLDGMFANFAGYLMSKGALLGLTRALARELGPHGVTVNFVSPGALESPAEHAAWGERWSTFDEEVKGYQSVKRRGGAADIANAVRFLCQDGSGFISGQQLRVDGGWVMA
ncbi:SDR family oxidoreductase [Sphingomonas parva]|uniref:SDR family oxidoreductase n=1 Tax=Sphingomonas parva TaxID=2555898 RepID=A0A4Y8ZQH2_9SPHN|nr:SDR family oxidoreductase [Sphingomonas parva]TFI58271.1 SDR family oxidoreductase [Sphingomonas parva]